jgi:hypothetical protein
MGLRRHAGKRVWIYYTMVDGKYWSRSTGQTALSSLTRQRLVKRSNGFFGLLLGLGQVDVMRHPLGLALHALGQFLQHVGR